MILKKDILIGNNSITLSDLQANPGNILSQCTWNHYHNTISVIKLNK